MVLDEAEFAKASEVWGGNTHDSATLKTTLEELAARGAGGTDAAVVTDRGIATAENLALLRERDYHYLVGLASQSRPDSSFNSSSTTSARLRGFQCLTTRRYRSKASCS